MSKNPQNPKFNEKHLKALGMIEKGGFMLKEIATACGWKPDYFYDLYEGNTAKCGEVATYFKAEVKKFDKEQTARIKELTKKNKELANKIIYNVLTRIEEKASSNRPIPLEEKKLVGTLMNCLAKASPSVEIGSLSYSYTKGFSAEQLVYEFNRLQSLTKRAPNRSAVQSVAEGGTGVLSAPVGSRGLLEEEA